MPTNDPPQTDASPWRRVRLALGAGVVVVLLAAGCGDDDDAATNDNADHSGTSGDATADTASDPAAYCDAELAIETAGEPEIDFETMTPDQQAAAAQAFATETMRPLVDALEPTVPAELSDQFDALNGALQQLEATGDFSVFDSPEVSAASEAAHAYDLENCDWSSRKVTATEYSFDGIPASLPAGVTSFDLTDGGTEAHELVLLRKNDGVTDSAEELLALPQAEAMQKVSLLGSAGPVPAGESAYVVADLDAGDYITVCFVPMGTTSLDGPPPEGPPHFMQGMVGEFTVS